MTFTTRPITAEERERYPLHVNEGAILKAAKSRRASVANIARYHRVPASEVQRVLHKAGIRIPYERKGDRLDVAQLRQDIAVGIKPLQLARKHHRPVQQMSRLLVMLKAEEGFAMDEDRTAGGPPQESTDAAERTSADEVQS